MKTTPWTDAVAKKLEPFDDLVLFALLGVIVVTLYVLFYGDMKARALWLAYVLLP